MNLIYGLPANPPKLLHAVVGMASAAAVGISAIIVNHFTINEFFIDVTASGVTLGVVGLTFIISRRAILRITTRLTPSQIEWHIRQGEKIEAEKAKRRDEADLAEMLKPTAPAKLPPKAGVPPPAAPATPVHQEHLPKRPTAAEIATVAEAKRLQELWGGENVS